MPILVNAGGVVAMGKRGKTFFVPRGMIWAFSFFIFLSGISKVGAMEKEPALILQKQDTGKEISLKTGQIIQVQLAGIAGTGYWWYVQGPDARHLELVSEKTRAASDRRVGGPVLGIWTFRTKDPGITEIKMDYYRKWEGVGKAIEKFRVRVTID
jgi:predicted secreted protein